ncbi:MAG TPA: class I SAM-dependent methyltransferase [Mycobacteriales bacterium]|jgi:SAM-dependent methyltransferase|nr:class I SAM-dependent methyltransferase [Mycobacteriales bacterium]
MTTGYALAYRLGITPWEKAGRDAAVQFNALLDREQQGDPPFGKALDIGCGTGDHAVNLARRGWQVTAIDDVPRALDAARVKSSDADVQVRWVTADVTDMATQVGDGFSLLLDVGCFHGLKPQQRAAYVHQAAAVSHRGATLLMLAFQPGRRPPAPLPRGVSRRELEDSFRDWDLIGDDAADTTCMSGPAKRTAPHFFRLRRRT